MSTAKLSVTSFFHELVSPILIHCLYKLEDLEAEERSCFCTDLMTGLFVLGIFLCALSETSVLLLQLSKVVKKT